MPKSAMITVPTADSKYSRQTLLGGPCGLAGGSIFFSWPLRWNSREKEKGFASVGVSVSVFRVLSVVRLLAIKNILETLLAVVKLNSMNRLGIRLCFPIRLTSSLRARPGRRLLRRL